MWASKQKPVNSGPLDIEASVENFKDGSHIVTKLFNATGDVSVGVCGCLCGCACGSCMYVIVCVVFVWLYVFVCMCGCIVVVCLGGCVC